MFRAFSSYNERFFFVSSCWWFPTISNQNVLFHHHVYVGQCWHLLGIIYWHVFIITGLCDGMSTSKLLLLVMLVLFMITTSFCFVDTFFGETGFRSLLSIVPNAGDDALYTTGRRRCNYEPEKFWGMPYGFVIINSTQKKSHQNILFANLHVFLNLLKWVG